MGNKRLVLRRRNLPPPVRRRPRRLRHLLRSGRRRARPLHQDRRVRCSSRAARRGRRRLDPLPPLQSPTTWAFLPRPRGLRRCVQGQGRRLWPCLRTSCPPPAPGCPDPAGFLGRRSVRLLPWQFSCRCQGRHLSSRRWRHSDDSCRIPAQFPGRSHRHFRRSCRLHTPPCRRPLGYRPGM